MRRGRILVIALCGLGMAVPAVARADTLPPIKHVLLFGLGHPGYAGLSGQTAFGSDIYTGDGPTSGPGCAASTVPLRRHGRLRRGAAR